MPTLPTQTFSNLDELITYINNFIIPNGNEEIIGEIHNNVENGLSKFIRQAPLNWSKAQIISAGGVQSASKAVVIFISSGASSFTFADNIYNEYVFVNATSNNIPLGSSQVYYDISLTPIDTIPALTVINIFKSTNDLWILGSSASVVGNPPKALRKVVGEEGAPVAGESTWQNDLLIGLDDTNNRISFLLDATPMMSYGLSQNCEYISADGIIDISPNTWVSGSGIEIPLLKSV